MRGGLGVVASDVERNRDVKMKGIIKTVCDVCLYKVGSSCPLYIWWQPSAIEIVISEGESGDLECVNYRGNRITKAPINKK
jgi:hypothetical protein